MRQLASLLLALTLLTLLPPRAHAEEEAPTLARPPRPLQLVPAEVPAGTVFPSAEVAVLLELELTEDGKVSSAKVLRGAGAPFDAAALGAVRKSRFSPALLSTGEAVPVSINFTLRIRRPEPARAASRPQPPPPAPVRFGGELVERGTRRPLAGVEVSAVAAGKTLASAVTDERGRFSLSVEATRFELTGAVLGHQPLRATVVARAGERREERFYLEATESSGYETVVESDRVKREVTRQVLPKQLIEKIPGTAGDTLKVVQILPGVARGAFDGGDPILRGSSPGDSRIFLEGQEIPILYHFGGIRSTFSSVFLESVDFVPGNFGAEYGRAIGGIINVKVRDPAHDTFRGLIDINVYDAGFALEGPLSKSWSIGGAFRRSWFDSILPAVLPDDAALSFDTLPRFYDYQLLASYRPSARRSLRIIGYGSLDGLSLVFSRPQSDPTIRGSGDARIMFHNLLVSYSERLGERLSQESSLQVGFQQLRTSLGPELFFDLGVTSFSARSAWAYQATRWLTARAGLDISVQDVQIDLSSPLRPLEGETVPPLSTRELVGVSAGAVLYNPAVFFELEVRPHERLTLIPSVRLDWYRELGRLTVDPRLTVRYDVRPGTVLTAAIGSYQQAPSPDQVVGPVANPNLRARESMHLSLGAKQRVKELLDVELTGFYKVLDLQVARNPLYAYDPRNVPYLSTGSGRIFGLELLVRARLGTRFNGWLAYTFQRSYRSDRPGDPERLFDFDQPHLLTLVGNVTLGRGWSTGVRFRLSSGNPYTPVLGSIYDAQSDVYVPRFGTTNSARRATFHQLDLRVDKVFTFKSWRLAAYLDVQNVYNQRNQEGVRYSYDYGSQQPVTGLPIVPILGLRGEW